MYVREKGPIINIPQSLGSTNSPVTTTGATGVMFVEESTNFKNVTISGNTSHAVSNAQIYPLFVMTMF